jgi:hypothetical protein
VGCTSTTLATGETCQHTASITLAPGSDSAFVLGPRGVAAVALPAGVAVMTAASAHPVASEQLRPMSDRPMQDQLRVMRPVGVLPGSHE